MLVTVLVSAALYCLMRVPAALGEHRWFALVCARLGMQPGDWHCGVGLWQSVVVYMAAAFLGGLAFALPAAVLAAAGRRFAFVVPILMPFAIWLMWAGATSLFFSPPANPADSFLGIRLPDLPLLAATPDSSFFATHVVLASIADAALLALPAALIPLRSPSRARRHDPDARSRASLIALASCGIVAAAVVFAARAMHLFGDGSGWAVPVAAMFAFALLLPTDRRWWPWVLAPVAVLLSTGPTEALRISLWRLQDFSAFGAALPLAVVGLVASGWAPLCERIERRMNRVEDEEDDEGWGEEWDQDQDREVTANPAIAALQTRVSSPGQSRAIRPVAALNAAAAGILVVAALMFALDPVGAQLASATPTYFGARVRVDDLRARMDLGAALAAANAYRAAHHTYGGFDAARGRALSPSFVWHQGLFAEGAAPPISVVNITPVPSTTRVQLVEVSASEHAFCVRDDLVTGKATYGSGEGRSWREAVAAAIARCGTTPWGPQALRPFPIATLCVGADVESLPYCRAVQQALRRELTLARPLG